jgi:threonine synthase
VSAHAARLGLPCYVFIPNDLEPNKILGSAIYGPQVIAVEGNYDDVNRLCTQIADRYGWGFANINLRSYYAEGAKTMGFEVAEQLGWRFPDHLVSPVAGGTLLPRIYKGFREFIEVGLVEGKLPRIHAAQPTGSAPVIRALESGAEFPDPVKPNTIAKSLAIGNPADGFQVVRVVKETGGSGAMVTDDEILDGIELLARTEGIFTEPAGGTTLAATRALIQRGVIKSNESVVVCITGNGYKPSWTSSPAKSWSWAAGRSPRARLSRFSRQVRESRSWLRRSGRRSSARMSRLFTVNSARRIWMARGGSSPRRRLLSTGR